MARGDGDTLLLAAGERIHAAVLVAREADQLQRIADLVLDVCAAPAFDPKTEGDVFRDAHMREQGVFLEDGIELAFVRRKLRDVLSVKDDLAAVRLLKAADDAQGRCFSAARRAEECHEGVFGHGQIQIVEDQIAVKAFGNMAQVNERSSGHGGVLLYHHAGRGPGKLRNSEVRRPRSGPRPLRS
jgi:hypothetical protein